MNRQQSKRLAGWSINFGCAILVIFISAMILAGSFHGANLLIFIAFPIHAVLLWVSLPLIGIKLKKSHLLLAMIFSPIVIFYTMFVISTGKYPENFSVSTRENVSLGKQKDHSDSMDDAFGGKNRV